MQQDAAPLIYVKAFNRPFQLERCLRSLDRFVEPKPRIVVLDDGTLAPYVAHIRELFPTVEYRFARHVDIRYETARRKISRQAMGLDDPSALWVEAIRDDPGDYVFLMEEDCWLAEPLNLPAIIREIRARGVLMARLCWCMSPRLGADADDVFEEMPLNDSLRLDFYLPKPSELVLDQVKIYAVANQIFRRDYWLAALENLPVWNDEITQYRNARAFIADMNKAGSTATFCQIHPEPVRQSWASTTTRDDFDPFIVNDVFNEAWKEGRLDAMANFPFDLPEAYLRDILSGQVPQTGIDEWLAWRRKVRYTYELFGSAIDQMFF
jgi:hypothetical protein